MKTTILQASVAGVVLDALTAHIAVTDCTGVITSVNRAWTDFGRANGSHDPAFGVGTDYLAVCAKAAPAEPSAAAALEGLRGVLGGTSETFELEYACQGPTAERWFAMQATRLPEGCGLVITHDDVTLRHTMEARLTWTATLLEKVLETLPVGVWIMDADGTIVFGNPEGQRIWAGARYVGPEDFGEYRAWWVETGEPVGPDEWAGARAIRSGEVSVGEELEIECFDGTRKIILNSAMPLRDLPGGVRGAIIVNQDITARKEAEAELRRSKAAVEAARGELQRALERERAAARMDPLTGVGNRRHFFSVAEHELAVSRRYGHPLSVILFDVDHFKRINDRLGHQAGDRALRRVANTAGAHTRESDLLARYGGEEFVMLLPQTTLEGAVALAERIRLEFLQQGATERLPAITISCGVTQLEPGDTRVEQLVDRADRAMYAAKWAGRNRTMMAPPAGESPGTPSPGEGAPAT